MLCLAEDTMNIPFSSKMMLSFSSKMMLPPKGSLKSLD